MVSEARNEMFTILIHRHLLLQAQQNIQQGPCDVCARLVFLDGAEPLTQFPTPSIVAFADGKTRSELAVMKFLSEQRRPKSNFPSDRMVSGKRQPGDVRYKGTSGG